MRAKKLDPQTGNQDTPKRRGRPPKTVSEEYLDSEIPKRKKRAGKRGMTGRSKRPESGRRKAKGSASLAARALGGSFRTNPQRAPAGFLAAQSPLASTAPATQRDYVQVAEQYAHDVLSGKRPAAELVKLACKRHLDDLAKSAKVSYPFYFDSGEARRWCENSERYPHIKGKWAAQRQKIHLEPFQCFALCVGFGWRKKANHKRRFREFYWEFPRKNAKSTIAAVIGNGMLTIDNEHGAEVYSGATSEKQAWEVFGPAKLMWEKSAPMMREFGVEVWARALIRIEDNSKFWPIIGKPGDGMSPSCAIIDEYHEHASPDQYDTMQTGMGAREQPLLVIITTAGTDLSSPCYDKHLEAVKVLQGALDNEELFALIYTIDEKDDWTSPDVLAKANPNIGVSVDPEYLAAQQRNAITNPAYQNRFKTKHLNVWCAASVAGINMHHWKLAHDKQMAIEEFRGEQCIGALDLASKTDICDYVKLFWRWVNAERHYYVFARHFLPEDTIEETRSNKAAYDKWVKQGHLIATDGAEIDFDLIREEVREDSSRFQFIEIVYDPWRATQLSHQLMKDGAKVVEMGQTAKNMGEAFDELLSALKGGRFHHNGDPVLEWMASNVISRHATKGVHVPGKDKPSQKIDGIVATVMAISRALKTEEDVGGLNQWLTNKEKLVA